MEVIRVSQTWQRAGAYYVRINTAVKGEKLPFELEFDDQDGEQARYLLVVDGQEPVATARLNLIDAQTAKIERVCVVAEYRRQGIGRRLINAAETWAKESGVTKIVITSRVPAVGFYERLNYQVNPNIRLKSRIPTVYMEKFL